jgi:hypothetical protein
MAFTLLIPGLGNSKSFSGDKSIHSDNRIDNKGAEKLERAQENELSSELYSIILAPKHFRLAVLQEQLLVDIHIFPPNHPFVPACNVSQQSMN